MPHPVQFVDSLMFVLYIIVALYPLQHCAGFSGTCERLFELLRFSAAVFLTTFSVI